VEHLPQGLSLLSILESSMNGVRMLRSRLEGLGKSLLVEGVDGVACGLRIAAQLVSYLVGVLAPVAGEKYLAQRRKVKASGERKPASRDSRSASLSGRTKIGCFMLWRITLNYRPVWECTRCYAPCHAPCHTLCHALCQVSTTVVNNEIVWHHALSD
jgi:hypothetical protein